MSIDSNDVILAQVDNELEEEAHEKHHRSGENNEETIQGEIIRDAIAIKI